MRFMALFVALQAVQIVITKEIVIPKVIASSTLYLGAQRIEYRIYDKRVNSSAAEQLCEETGGILAQPKSWDEWEHIDSLFSSNCAGTLPLQI